YDDEFDEYDEDGEYGTEHPEDFSDGYYDDEAGYADDEAQAWPSATQPTVPLARPDGPSGTPMDNYPIDEEEPPVPAPAARSRKKS
ncbi:cell division protein FtsK, partial [Mycobacterium sp. ITM-2017-0098]